MPERIQLRRSRGWRLPPNTVVVARPTRWGNPYRISKASANLPEVSGHDAVRLYREALTAKIATHPSVLEDIRATLGGRNLACWCRLGAPCHADVLLELANPPTCEAVT